MKTQAKSKSNKCPDPGTYNPRDSYTKENLGTCKIGTGTRDGNTQLPGGKEVPGPGNYNIRGSLGGPSFGIGSSMRDALGGMNDKNSLGPGHYHVPTYTGNLPKYTMPDRPDNLRYI